MTPTKLRKGFTQVPNTWISNLPLKAVERALVIAILSHGDDYEPTYEQLAFEAGCSRATLARVLKRLRKRGFVWEVRRRVDKHGRTRVVWAVDGDVIGPFIESFTGNSQSFTGNNHAPVSVSPGDPARSHRETRPPVSPVSLRGSKKTPEQSKRRLTGEQQAAVPFSTSSASSAPRLLVGMTEDVETRDGRRSVMEILASVRNAKKASRRKFGERVKADMEKHHVRTLTKGRVDTLVKIYDEMVVEEDGYLTKGEHDGQPQQETVRAAANHRVDNTQGYPGAEGRVSPTRSANSTQGLRGADGGDVGRRPTARVSIAHPAPLYVPPKHKPGCSCRDCYFAEIENDPEWSDRAV